MLERYRLLQPWALRRHRHVPEPGARHPRPPPRGDAPGRPLAGGRGKQECGRPCRRDRRMCSVFNQRTPFYDHIGLRPRKLRRTRGSPLCDLLYPREPRSSPPRDRPRYGSPRRPRGLRRLVLPGESGRAGRGCRGIPAHPLLHGRRHPRRRGSPPARRPCDARCGDDRREPRNSADDGRRLRRAHRARRNRHHRRGGASRLRARPRSAVLGLHERSRRLERLRVRRKRFYRDGRPDRGTCGC